MGGFSWKDVLTSKVEPIGGPFDRWKNVVVGATTDRLDTEALKNQLHGLLHGNCVGYAFQLRKRGKTIMFGQDGSAQIIPGAEVPLGNTGKTTKLPSEEIPFGQDTVMTIASLGKLFTAVLTVRLLDEHGIDVDSAIGPHLPSWWSVDDSVAALTFRQLLTHGSRLGVGYDIKDDSVVVTRSILKKPLMGDRDPEYRNLNFIVLRILIYRIIRAHQTPAFNARGVTPVPQVGVTVGYPESDEQLQNNSIDTFDAYAQAHLFGPAGVSASLLAPPGTAYHFHYPYGGGHETLPDIRIHAGAGGWYMSSNGVLRTMAGFRRRGVAITPARAKELEAQTLGLDFGQDTKIGRITFKNGGSGVGQCVQQTVGALLPDDMELVVFVSSNVPGSDVQGGPNLQDKVRDAVLASIRPWSYWGGFG